MSHEAVGVIAAVTATRVALVIVPKAHAVEGVDELVIVFSIFEDVDFVVLLLARHRLSELISALASCVGSGD